MHDTCWEAYGGYIKQRRDAGDSLKKIGDEVGCTKQRICQILVRHYGTADSEGTLSTSQLLEQLGCSHGTLYNIRKKWAIPQVSRGRWKPETLALILKLSRKCKMCGKPVVKKRMSYFHAASSTCTAWLNLDSGNFGRPNSIRKRSWPKADAVWGAPAHH